MPEPLIGVPIASFRRAKRRLSPHLDEDGRRLLAEGLAVNTVHTIRAAGHQPTVVSSADDVGHWARRSDVRCIDERSIGGLDGAGAALLAEADGRPWMLLHSDLPCLSADDIEAGVAALARGAVISPSYDAGTTLIGAHEPLSLAYGVGSFHRHLRALGPATVLTTIGLQLDIDSWADLVAARDHPHGAWLRDLALDRTDETTS